MGRVPEAPKTGPAKETNNVRAMNAVFVRSFKSSRPSVFVRASCFLKYSIVSSSNHFDGLYEPIGSRSKALPRDASVTFRQDAATRVWTLARCCERLWHQLSKAHTGLVQLRLGITHGATHNPRDFVVFVSLNVVQNQHLFAATRQLVDSILQIDAVNYAVQV